MIATRRTELLIQAADHVARTGGLDIMLNLRGITAAWERAHPASFARLVELAGLPAPSDDQPRQHFLAALRDRAEQGVRL